MKSSLSKSMKTGAGKKRTRDEVDGSAQGSMPYLSPVPESEQRVEEIEGKDRRLACAGE
jgi:predicted Zn-dependent protease